MEGCLRRDSLAFKHDFRDFVELFSEDFNRRCFDEEQCGVVVAARVCFYGRCVFRCDFYDFECEGF